MTHPDRLLTPAEVAQMFGVAPQTVGRWAERGRLRAIYTPGGHRRFRESDVIALLAASNEPGQDTGPTTRPIAE